MFETIAAFFAASFAAVLILGSAWFWVTSVALFVLVLAFEENDRHFFAGLSVLAFVWVMESSGAISIFTSPFTVLMWGAVYMGAGAVWSFVKWFSFLNSRSDKLLKFKLKWIDERNKVVDVNKSRGYGQESDSEQRELLTAAVGTKIPKAEMEDFRRDLDRSGYFRDIGSNSEKLIPQIGDNKARITSWIVWWPWSALWTLLNDPIRRLAEFIYTQLQTTYQRLANKVFAKFQVEE